MTDAVLVYDSSNSCSLEDMSMGSIFLDLPVHNTSHNFSQHIQASGPGELVPLPRANPYAYGEHEPVDSRGEKGSVERKVTTSEERKRKNSINSGHLVPWQHTQAARTNYCYRQRPDNGQSQVWRQRTA